MSKIEDDTKRGNRQRSATSISITTAVDDVADVPEVVPADQSWSVDDDLPVDRHESAPESAAESEADAEMASPTAAQETLFDPEPLSVPNNGHRKAASDQPRKVKRFGVSARNDDEDQASDASDVADPTDTVAVDEQGPPTAEVSVISADHSTESLPASFDDEPLIIHEQTVMEPLAREPSTVDRDDVAHAFQDPWNDGGFLGNGSQSGLLTYGTPAAGIPMPHPGSEPLRKRRRVRRVNRVLRHIDPWSIFKVGLLFNLIGYLVVMTAGVLLWGVASRTGTLPNIERWFTQFGWETFALDGNAIFKNAAVAGLFGAAGLTGAFVMFATVFNLVSDAIGGIRVSVLEEEVIAIAEDGPTVGPIVGPSHQQAADNWAIEDF